MRTQTAYSQPHMVRYIPRKFKPVVQLGIIVFKTKLRAHWLDRCGEITAGTAVYIYLVYTHVRIHMYMNNHVHSAPQEHIERERKDSEHRKNTQNIHNITTIHKPHGLEK